MKKHRLNAYFDPALIAPLGALAARARVSKSAILEAALAAHLSPDAADQHEAALARRLDRLTRDLERLARDQAIATEALALFIRVWLSSTPPPPDPQSPATQAKGRERYQGFVEALGRRMARGQALAKEVVEEVEQE